MQQMIITKCSIPSARHAHPPNPFFHSGRFLNPKGLRDGRGGCLVLPVGIHHYRRHTRSGKLPRANRPTTRQRRPRAVSFAQTALSRRHHKWKQGIEGNCPFVFAAAIVPPPTTPTSSVEAWMTFEYPQAGRLSVRAVPKATHWRRYERLQARVTVDFGGPYRLPVPWEAGRRAEYRFRAFQASLDAHAHNGHWQTFLGA
jgi:hypothetical protein